MFAIMRNLLGGIIEEIPVLRRIKDELTTKYIKCNHPDGERLPDTIQRNASALGVNVTCHILYNGVPGFLVFGMPGDDGETDLVICPLRSYEDVARASIYTPVKVKAVNDFLKSKLPGRKNEEEEEGEEV